MLPFEEGLSYASVVLVALRTQTATRYFVLGAPGVHVNALLVFQPDAAVHEVPSKIHHLY
jgi:hypothetical protein